MKIIEPHIKQTEKSITISYPLIYKRTIKKPMYIKVPIEYKDFLSTDASGIIAPLIIPSMKLGENIYAPSASTVLTSRFPELIHTINKWEHTLKEIRILVEKPKADTTTNTYSALFFSSGVDSFYTLLELLKENKKSLTHLLFVHGFDIEVENTSLYQQTFAKIKALAKDFNLTVVPVETNMRKITDEFIGWDLGYIGAMSGVALFLRNGFKDIYVAGADPRNNIYPYGIPHEINSMFNTETLNIIHHGKLVNRMEKISQTISRSDVALRNLRVCWKNIDGKYNCGLCGKCLRTMMELEIAGVLDKAITFKEKLDLERVGKLYAPNLVSSLHLVDCLKTLERLNSKPELQDALRFCLTQSKKPSLIRKLRNFVNELDARYNNHRLYWYLTKREVIH